MPFVTNDGCEIWYEEHRGKGPILVYISGYMGISSIWDPLIAKLGDKYRHIVHDNRGYGRSSKPESDAVYTIPRHADDLAAILEALHIKDRVVLVTHSMGGNIATDFHLKYPGRVAGIVYAAAYYDGKRFSKLGATPRLLAENADSPSKSADHFVGQGLPYGIAIEAAKWPPHGRRNNAKGLLEYEIGNEYSEITVPTLAVHGDVDKTTPHESLVKPMVDALPNSKLVLLKGVNHFPQVEATEDFSQLVEDFVISISM